MKRGAFSDGPIVPRLYVAGVAPWQGFVKLNAFCIGRRYLWLPLRA